MEDLSAHPLRAAVALDLLKVPEDLLALLVGRSVRLPGAVALLAQTAMGAAVHSDAAAVGVALEVPPVVVPSEVLQAAAFQAAVVGVVATGVAEAVDHIGTAKLRRGPFGPLLLS